MARHAQTLCLMAVLLSAAFMADASSRSLAQFKPPDSNALDNGTPYDALWVCTTYASGVTWQGECGSTQTKNAFLSLIRAVVPAAYQRVDSLMTYDVNVGCCAQMDINGTTINSTATDRSFAFMGAGTTAKPGLNNKNTQTLIANWAKANGICGPTASIPWVVGWDLYSPIRVKYFSCVAGTLGTRLPSLCRC